MLALIITLLWFVIFGLMTMLGLLALFLKVKQGTKILAAAFSFSVGLIAVTLVADQMFAFIGKEMSPVFISLSGLMSLLILVKIFLVLHKASVNHLKIMKEDWGVLVDYLPKGVTEHPDFFKSIASIYIVSALMNMVYFYFFDMTLLLSLSVGIAMMLMGVILGLVPFIPIKIDQEINLLIMVSALTIPMLCFSLLRLYGSDVVWALPLIFLLIPIIYNSFKMYAWIARVSTAVLLTSWWLLPVARVPSTVINAIIKIALYIVCIILAGYINNNYIDKLHTIRRQTQLNRLLSGHSKEFTQVTEASFDMTCEKLVESVGACIDADRAYLVFFEGGGENLDVRYEWVKDGKASLKDSIESIDLTLIGWFQEMILSGNQLFVRRVKDLPRQAYGERAYMTKYAIQSLIYLPIQAEGSVIGLVGFDQMVSRQKKLRFNNELLNVVPNIVSDAMIKIKAEKSLNQLAYFDELTGLPNRASLHNTIGLAIDEVELSGGKFAIIFFDLDGFKTINDSLGHNVGDELLRQVGGRLSSLIKKDLTVARVGGDEFILILKDMHDQAKIEVVVNKVFKLFVKPFRMFGQDYHMTISAGIVIYSENMDDSTMMMKYADIAMYEAKKRGKNRYVIYSEEINSHMLRNLNLTNSLQDAVKNQEIYLMYQPQVSIATGEIIGYEALARWEHPIYGNVPPNIFIAMAEETGLIHEIGKWIIQEACDQNKRWQDQGQKPVVMAVNISVEQFGREDLVAIIQGALKSSGLEGRYLEIEITESIAMKTSIDTVQSLKALKALGLSISIDDFGTGHSSFRRLRELPIDRLKIDIQFIRGIGIHDKDEAIIKTLIYLAKSLGMTCIAEGVEEEAQRDFLKSEACDEIQGYLYYKPLLAKVIDGLFLACP